MISELRLAQIVAVITELSEQKKQDFYRFLLDLKERCETILTNDDVERIMQLLREVQTGLGKKVDKVSGKGLSSNDFTNELRTKLINIIGNVQANWNTSNESDPSYIVNKPDLSNLGLSQEDRNKIDSITPQVPSDWEQSDDTKPDFIKNKPTIPNPSDFEQLQPDWSQSDNTKKDFIKNKPTIPDAQIQADWNQSDQNAKDFIKNKPSIPTSNGTGTQVQADWNQSDNTQPDFIKNKPTIPSTSGCEVTSNKVTSLSSSSTDTEYPSAKCVYDIVGNIESTLNAILGV